MKARLALLVVACVALSACSTMSKMWPFHQKSKPVPPPVHELNLVNADGSEATYPQLWVRNTLVLDLTGVSGAGAVAARLPEETTWPVRVALRVRPGSVEQLEVQGEERDVLPVTKDGVKPIDITLAHSVYTPKTAAIYISWGTMPVFAAAPVAPAPDHGFVSPQQLPPGVSATPTEPATNEPTSASGVIPPGSAPAQPSPPPGN
jgi:hypothetical protein